MADRYVAVLQWLGGDLGYGFVVQENGKDVVVHYEPVPGEGFRILIEGNQCGFAVENGPKGRTAVNIYQPKDNPPLPRVAR